MIYALLALLVFGANEANHHLETTPFQMTDREIVLADVHLFVVSDRGYAMHMSQIAEKHKEAFQAQVDVWNHPMKAWTWARECDWRKACWRELADAIYDPSFMTYCNGSHYRLTSLYRLRDLLGYEAFYAGQMPAPTPNYNILPR